MADAILKRCCSCGETKHAEHFHKASRRLDGLRSACKACANARSIELYEADRERILAKNARWVAANRDKALASRERWLAANPGRMLELNKLWRDKNSERRAELRKVERSRPSVRIHRSIGNRIRDALSDKNRARTFDLLNYSVGDLVSHLERQFLTGMSWKNYGRWHIDHIQPLASFTISGRDDPELKVAWGLPNLRPLWAVDNQKKHAKRTHLI